MSEENIAQAHALVERSALGIELLAIVLIVSAILFSTAVYVYGVATRRERSGSVAVDALDRDVHVLGGAIDIHAQVDARGGPQT